MSFNSNSLHIDVLLDGRGHHHFSPPPILSRKPLIPLPVWNQVYALMSVSVSSGHTDSYLCHPFALSLSSLSIVKVCQHFILLTCPTWLATSNFSNKLTVLICCLFRCSVALFYCIFLFKKKQQQRKTHIIHAIDVFRVVGLLCFIFIQCSAILHLKTFRQCNCQISIYLLQRATFVVYFVITAKQQRCLSDMNYTENTCHLIRL